MRKILAVTGIRSEYFFSRPVYQAIQAHPGLDLRLVVTGAHLSPLHGYTVSSIEADGLPIEERIESLLYSDRDAARLKGAALQLGVLAHVVDRERPDVLFAVGDREEPMMLALCGAYMNIPTVHYCAGDRVVGNVDDFVRHAVSRLSHKMLTLSEDASQRLIRAGEEPWRVECVGHAGLDRIRDTEEMGSAELASALGVDAMPERYAVVIHHPLSSEAGRAGQQMRMILGALRDAGMPVFVSYPNSDAGAQDIVAAIEESVASGEAVAFRNVPDAPFVNLLRRACVLVGNSSLGVFEAPFLRLPTINVGGRQAQRLHAENMLFVDADRAALDHALSDVLHNTALRAKMERCSNFFGDGRTSGRIAGVLAEMALDGRLLNKDLTY